MSFLKVKLVNNHNANFYFLDNHRNDIKVGCFESKSNCSRDEKFQVLPNQSAILTVAYKLLASSVPSPENAGAETEESRRRTGGEKKKI